MSLSYHRRSPFVFVALILSTSIVGRNRPPPTRFSPADLDAYVAASMKTFNVPGMAVAIVKNGKIVVAKGYGARKLGDPTPVDRFTKFGIGSNTKAFTSAVLATLIDEGKLSWNDPHLPAPPRLRHVRPLRLARNDHPQIF